MENKLLAIKASASAFFTAVIAFLGWQGVLFVLWVAVVAIDFLSGTLAAWLNGDWASGVAREGAKHKLGMLFVVIVAGITDLTLAFVCQYLLGFAWPVLTLTLMFIWYILTESGSILENAVKLGANIPEWFMNLLSAGLRIINTKGDGLTDVVGEAAIPGGEDKQSNG